MMSSFTIENLLAKSKNAKLKEEPKHMPVLTHAVKKQECFEAQNWCRNPTRIRPSDNTSHFERQQEESCQQCCDAHKVDYAANFVDRRDRKHLGQGSGRLERQPDARNCQTFAINHWPKTCPSTCTCFAQYRPSLQMPTDKAETGLINMPPSFHGTNFVKCIFQRKFSVDDNVQEIRRPVPVYEYKNSGHDGSDGRIKKGGDQTEQTCETFDWMTNPRPFYKKDSKRHLKHPDSKRDRTTFNKRQRTELERQFQISRYPSRYHRAQIARFLDLTEFQVKVWFQNRRMKYKRWNSATRHSNTVLPSCYCSHAWPDRNRTTNLNS